MSKPYESFSKQEGEQRAKPSWIWAYLTWIQIGEKIMKEKKA